MSFPLEINLILLQYWHAIQSQIATTSRLEYFTMDCVLLAHLIMSKICY